MTTPLEGLEEVIVGKRNAGVPISKIAAEHGVSRQAVYHLLNRNGVSTTRKKKEPRPRSCSVCGGTFTPRRNSSTCSPGCRKELAGRSRRKKGSKFGRELLELSCLTCGKKFTRTKHQQSVSMRDGRVKRGDFCGRECYAKSLKKTSK